LEISAVPRKAMSREPAYSEALAQNMINRLERGYIGYKSRSKMRDRQAGRRLRWMEFKPPGR